MVDELKVKTEISSMVSTQYYNSIYSVVNTTISALNMNSIMGS